MVIKFLLKLIHNAIWWFNTTFWLTTENSLQSFTIIALGVIRVRIGPSHSCCKGETKLDRVLRRSDLNYFKRHCSMVFKKINILFQFVNLASDFKTTKTFSRDMLDFVKDEDVLQNVRLFFQWKDVI